MKIISLKLKITTFLLLFLACHGVLAQNTSENLKSSIANNDTVTAQLTTSSQNSNRMLPPVITGNFSICLPGPTTTQLTASLPPAPVTATTPWVSSNLAVATISATGLVTQVSFGATTITYTDNLGNTYSENVYVSTFPTITTTFGTSTCAGGTLQIDGSLFPNTTTPWTSLTPAIASVDSSGLITGITGGSATIQYMNLGGCTTTTPITINPLLIPTVTCGATTTNQITFNWTAVAGATTYVRSYQIGAGPFQSAGSGNATTYTLTGLLPSTTVTFYVAPSGSVGSCFQVGQVTCSTLPCDAITTPVAPTIGVITQPSCFLATGSVAISGLPAGNWTLNQTGTAANTIAGNTATTTISGLATGNYSFTVLNNLGCTSLASANVNIAGVPPIPAAPISTGNITQCQQLPIQTLNANTAITVIPGQTISWYTLAVGGVLVPTPTLNTVGTVTYYAQANDGTCDSNTRTAVTLTITGAPAAPISTGNITQCQQLPIQTLNANTAITVIPGQTISWYNLAVGGVLVPTPTLNTVGTVTYYAQANDGTCDSTTRTAVTLTITGAPAAPTSTGNITQCQQLPIQTLDANNAITVIPGQTISWYTLAVGGVLVPTPTRNTVGTITYYGQAFDGTCSSLTRTSVTLTITGAPAAPISTGNITQCQQLPIQTLNANTSITVIPGQTISWYTLAVGGVLVPSPTLSAVGTATYFAQANDGTCDSTTRTGVTLTITGAPAAPISTGNITQCQQLPIQTLNANTAITVIPGQTISWYTLAVGGVLVPIPTLNTVGTITYYAQANDGTCDSTTRTSVTLTITGAAAAPISTGNITQCEQLPIQTLDANTAITVIPGQTISWYTLAVGGVLVASPTLNTVGTATFFAQANDGTCSSSTRTAVTLTLTGAPAAPISTGNITQCQQLPIQTLNANTAITVIPGQTISWYTLAVGGVLVPTPTLNTVGTATYFAQANDGTCDSLTRTSVTLTITGAPAAPISTGDITECVQLPIQTLNANTAITVIPGQTISWYTLAVGGVLVASPTLNTVGTITYFAQANDGTCDSTTRTAVTLTITGAPAAPISTGDITECEELPIQTLDTNTAITVIPGQTISWYDLAVGGVLVASPTLNAVGTATYFAQANDGTCASLTRTSVTLTITGAPAAPISTGDITECEQLPIQTLNANTAITVIPGQTISWYTLAVGGVLVPTPTLNTVGTATYYAQANDGTCDSTTRTAVTLTITGAPAAPISTGDITECEQLPIQTLDANNAITVIPGQTISWYTLAVGGVLVASPTLNTVGTITYFAQANDGTCDSTTRTAVTLTIIGAPAAPISTGDITECELFPIQTLDANNAITVIPGQTISWYTLAIGGVLVPTPTLNTVGTATYFAQANDGTCDSLTRTSVTLTITGAPAAPISTGDITECVQLPIQTLNANTAITVIPGQTISWYTLAVGGVLVASPTLNTVGTITYFAQANDGTCDSSTRTAVTLTITGAPAAPISTGDITECEELPIQTLDANNAITIIPGQTISWYDLAVGGVLVASPTLNTVGTATYFAQANDGTCASLTRTSVTLTITGAPAAPISTGDITECEQLPIQTINANTAITVIPGQTISWYTLAVGGVLVPTPTLNTVGTITYFAQANDGTCDSTTRTAVTLTITGAPAAPISTGDITECEQLPIQTLDANNAITVIPGQTISWYTLAVGGVLVPTPTLNTVGTATYFAQANDGTCDSTTRTAVTLTITGAPAAPISTGDITECELFPIQTLDANNAITVIPGQTISWYTLAVGGVLVPTPTLNTVGTATYFAQANDGTCDSLTRTSVTLTITGAPAAPISTGDITECEQLPIQTLNANTAITVIPGQTISWYTLAVGGVLVASPTLNTVGTITYFAQANDGTCDSSTRTAVTLTITGAPAAPISTGDITECEELPIQTLDANNAITVIPGQTISWYDLAVGGVLVASPTLNTVGTATYFAQANDGTCDSLTRTSVTLTITGAPAAPISTGNITQCQQLPIQTLNANTAITVISGQTISWYTLAVGGVLVPTPTLNTVGTITYYAQAFDGTCSSVTRTAVTLTITVAPAAPISTGDITECEQLPIQTLDANNAITVIPGQTISWYTLAVGGILVASPTLNTVGTITYFAQANDGTCDSTTRTAVTLTITGAPAVPISTGNITQCQQLPIQTLNANTAITVIPGQTISWYTLAVGGVLVPTPTLNAVGTATYFAQANDGTCDSLTRTTVTLTITGAPAAPISTGNITQCQQLPIQTLNANNAITVIPGQTISWYTLAVGGILVPTPTLNTVGTVTYYAQAFDGTCSSVTRTAVTLTIIGAPAAPISTGNITQCQQLPIQTLNANTALTVIPGQTISWYTLAVGGVLVPTPTLNTVGTITYFAQTNDGTCDSTTRTAVTLTITGAPAAPISTGAITECEQLPIQTLNANNAITLIPGQTISWYTLAVGGVLVPTPTLNTVGTVTYYAQAFDGTCNSLTRTAVTLTITGAPAAPISTGNITQCEQLPIQTLDANNAIAIIPGETISWYNLAVGGVLVPAPTLNTVGTITYYAQVFDGTCNSLTRTAVTLTIIGAPAAPISTGDITECEQQSIQTLDANDAITIVPGQINSWYDLASGGILVPTPTLNAVGTITYYAESTVGTCNSLTRTAVTLTINAAPAPPVSGGDIFQCEQSPLQTITATATVPSGETVIWYDAPNAGTVVVNPSINTAISVVYFAEAFNGTCPSLTRTPVILTINELPADPVVGLLTQPDCFTSTGSITIFPVPAGISYSFDGGTFTTTTFYGLLPNGTNHTIIAKNTGGCLSQPIIVSILPQPSTPAAPTVVITQPTCTVPTGAITINGVPGETYSFDGGPFTNQLVYNGLIAASTHTLKTKNASGCISTTTSITLNIQPLTPAPPTLTPIQPTCTEGTGTVQIANVLGQTYSFDGSPFTATLNYPGLIGGSTHIVTAQNGSGCISAASTITLDISPPTPNAPAIFAAQPDCTEAFGEITILNVAGETYSFDGGPYGPNLIYSDLAAGTYAITATNSFGCISPSTTVTIIPQPITLTPTITDGVICVDAATGVPFRTHILETGLNLATHSFVWTLDGTVFPETGSSIEVDTPGVYTVVATNISTGCDSQIATATVTESFSGLGIAAQVINQFSDDAGVIINVNSGTGPFVYQLDNGPPQESNLFLPVSPGSHIVHVTDVNGCTDLTSEITVLGYLKFFTPNDDTYNDTWNIIGLEGQPAAIIHIYDRYAKYIKQISANGKGWDGTLNGEHLPSTDYWFTVEYVENGQSKEFKSHFSLVR